MRCIGEGVERLDAVLATLAQAEAALRLRLGQVLEVMSRGGVFELGFSSLGAYAVERCERSARWSEAARCLARRVDRLPGLRHGIAMGRVSWSMGELLARVARPDDEERWVAMAESRTVRQMRGVVAEAMAGLREGGTGTVHATAIAVGERASGTVESKGSVPGDDCAADGCAANDCAADNCAAEGGESADGCDAMCTLTCTVDQEDAWLFEATRLLLEQLGVHGGDAQSEALLAEAQGTLLALMPEGTLDPDRVKGCDMGQQRWLNELARWRAEAEVLCERNSRGWLRESRAHRGEIEGRRMNGRDSEERHCSVAVAAALGMASLERMHSRVLDGEVRALCLALARHELELSQLILRFHRADGWRRLGYATETQYARERLGLSHSSVLARRSLALRLQKLPVVGFALGAGQLGVEAALQVVRVATPSTEAAWVARARKRTIKHLREEVAAALTAVRWSGEVNCLPPVDDEMVAFHALEQAVVSGRVCQPQAANAGRDGVAERPHTMAVRHLTDPESDQRRAWFVMLGSLAAWLENGLQMSAVRRNATRSLAGSKAGRVTLRLRMSRATSRWWRGLEAQAHAWLPRRVSWLKFLCLSLWHAWRHLLGEEVAYGHVYLRDRYRCMSPVCSRRDVTPHHLVFRSAGGSDDDDNIASVCTWCHLRGVHGGRIRVRGTARFIRWEIGAARSPCIVVHGRERCQA